MRSGLAFGIAVLASVVLCSPALGQERDDEAHGLHMAGAAAFASGHYEEALAYFQRAYDLSHRPELLFNIGQAADRDRQDEIALGAFREYLAAVADAPDREEIAGRIRVLERAVAAHTAAPAPPEIAAAALTPDAETPQTTPEAAPTTPVREPEPREPPVVQASTVDVGAIALTAAGGVAIVAGAIMLGVGLPDLLAPVDPHPSAADAPAQNARIQNGQILTGIGGAAVGLGLVGVVIGIVILSTPQAPPASTGARLTPNGFAIIF